MDENITFRTIWREAGISALILTAVCAAEFVVETFCSMHADAGWASILKTVVDLGKIVACIYLMRAFMMKFKNEYPDASRAQVRKLGYIIGVVSGLCLSAIMMAWYMWHPDIIRETIDLAMSQMSQYMDRNATEALENVENNFPQIVFFTNFVYCSIWAFILPAILAGKVVKDNPFEDEDDE